MCMHANTHTHTHTHTQDKLNRTRVVRAAVYDLITSQCDRHAQNVFIDEQGDIKLIDNLNVSVTETVCVWE